VNCGRGRHDSATVDLVDIVIGCESQAHGDPPMK
jgi:hypothetical protein